MAGLEQRRWRTKGWQVGSSWQWEKREKTTSLEGINQKGKHIFIEAPSAHGPDGSVREVATYEEGWADAGRAGLVGSDPGENSNGNFISNFKWIWNLEGLWEFFQGNLEGIWAWGFFLNSSRVLKDF
jgi:hypothetical protein